MMLHGANVEYEEEIIQFDSWKEVQCDGVICGYQLVNDELMSNSTAQAIHERCYHQPTIVAVIQENGVACFGSLFEV